MTNTQDIHQTVFVGLSGGVDSSVAALRLKNQGYNVVGVFIKVWHPDWMVCNWEAERLDAMRVAAQLQIPFLTCDAEEAYKNDVADYFISEYQAGRTPNPDVMCNKYVKFGAFLQFAEAHGADYVATGHYAQRIDKSGTAILHRGHDAHKDQTYFLWTLTQAQLKKTLFPVGDTPKNEIRKEAEAAGLLTAEKKDSQGICFLGHVDIPEFLSHYIDLQSGKVLSENGEVIGTHKGALVYTKGQRHGFAITSHDTTRSALYVVERNIPENTITVATEKPLQPAMSTLCLSECSVTHLPPKAGEVIQIQNRYRQTPISATVDEVTDTTITLSPHDTSEAVSYGQSCVLYRDEECLGGGIISECPSPL